ILKRIAKICRAAEMADARVIDLFRRCDPIFVSHRVEPTDRGPNRSRAFDTSLLGARPIPPREHAIVSIRSAFAARYKLPELRGCRSGHLLKYFREVQPFVRKPSCKRPLAHSQTASNVVHEHSSMRSSEATPFSSQATASPSMLAM